jgi:tRNA G18 (ribose-2'-O)-methylase SpoU
MKTDPKSNPSLRERDLAAEGLILLEGSFLVERGLDSGIEMDEILCVPDAASRWETLAAGRCPVRSAPESALAEYAGYPFHRGVLALAKKPESRSFDSASDLPHGNALCLWQVTDPENVGALIRSGAALGAASVLLGPGCADPFYHKALRSSMGAALSLPLIQLSPDRVSSIPSYGFLAAAAVLGGESLKGLKRRLPPGKTPIALFLGNEGWGLPGEVISICGLQVEIPMSGKTDSLNVAAAGAILMWELFS